MNYPNKEIVESIKRRYPIGSMVELISMNDPYCKLAEGETGIVQYVDDIGTIHVKWNNGSSLGVAYGEDSCRPLGMICPKCGRLYNEHSAISRRDGKTNICPECGVREALEDFKEFSSHQ